MEHLDFFPDVRCSLVNFSSLTWLVRLGCQKYNFHFSAVTYTIISGDELLSNEIYGSLQSHLALLTITAVALFAFQGNDLDRGYLVEVTFSFYMEVRGQNFDYGKKISH